MNNKAFNIKECIQSLNLMGRRKWLYLIGAIGDGASYASLPIIAAFVYIDSFNAAMNRDTNLIFKAAILFSISVVTVSIIAAIFKYLSIYTAKAAVRDLREMLYASIIDLPIAKHEQTHSGDYISRMTADIESVEGLYLNHFKSFFYFLNYSVGSIVTMLILEWRIALILILITFISSFFVSKFANSLRVLSNELQKVKAEMNERTIDALSGLRVIKMFQAEQFILQRSSETNERLTSLKKKVGAKTAIMDAVSYLLHIINYYGVILCGIFLIITGHIGIGIVIAFAQLQFNMSNAFLQLGQFVVQLQGGLAGSARVVELLNESKEQNENYEQTPDSHEAVQELENKAEVQSNMVQFQNVSFAYPNSEPTLMDLCFEIKQGQIAAFVGASGGGKSTIVKLLLGFYKHQHGEIMINQKLLTQYSLSDLREMISYIPQDAYLFDGSIYDNIRYGRLDATEEEVRQAAIAAIAHDFIETFPNSYQTQVGERGSRLSGGQRQRIAIARAILKNAPIVVLDEATSALDGESESQVQDSLLRLMENRTAFVIAHRLSAINKADQIFVVGNGKVVENGTKEELIALRGAYYELHQQRDLAN